MKVLFLLLVISLGFGGCARNPAHIAFDKDLLELDRRAKAGDPQEIASQYHSMSQDSYKESDRIGLRFRAVDILIRAGDAEGARKILTELESLGLKGAGSGLIKLREARILDRIAKNRAGALELYTEVILRNQNNIAARFALKDLRMMLVLADDEEAWKQALSHFAEKGSDLQFRVLISYKRAEQHIYEGQEGEAIKLFEEIHKKHRASLLWARTTKRLAAMLRARKMPKREVEVLVSLGGSLSKRGELRLAELYCHALKKPSEGIRWMKGFEDRHPRSTLRDDAMWRLAECYGSQNNRVAQKNTMCSILERFPLTRNARRARRAMGMVIGPGLGGSGAENQGRQPCGLLSSSKDLARLEQP